MWWNSPQKKSIWFAKLGYPISWKVPVEIDEAQSSGSINVNFSAEIHFHNFEKKEAIRRWIIAATEKYLTKLHRK